jgi:hypothetical protein
MWIALGFIVAYYGMVPIIHYLRRRPLGGTFDQQWDLASDGEFPVQTETQLQLVGFSPPTHLYADGATAVAYMSLLRHKDDTTVATATTMITTRAPTAGRRTMALLFRSHCADGRVLITTNQATGRIFPSMPYHDSMRFGDVRDPAALFLLHQRRVAVEHVVNPIPDGDIVAYVNREARRLREGFIAMGYIRKQSDGTERVTLLGSALLAWRRLFPWRQINNWRDARAAAAYLT